MLAVDLAVHQGGPTVFDRFTPANRLIVRTFTAKWPNCPAARAANGFPRIVERNGKFEFEEPCKPCEAEPPRNAELVPL